MTCRNHLYIAACLKSPGAALTGGVRLEPASAPLWAGLGSCAVRPKHQEYAFTRSLQLDPKSAHTWAALGRLYMESGARHLADTCFTQARSQEPADAATWAAMGALAGLSPTGEPCTTYPLLLFWWSARVQHVWWTLVLPCPSSECLHL